MNSFSANHIVRIVSGLVLLAFLALPARAIEIKRVVSPGGITAWLVADNVASARVLEKNGFQLEGRLRDKERYKGRYWDVLMYARVAEE